MVEQGPAQRAQPVDDGTGRHLGGDVARKITLRQWQNTVGGLVSVALIVGLTVASDPFGLYTTWVEEGQGLYAGLAPYVGVLALISVFAAFIFVVPRVVLNGDNVTLINPLRVVRIPANLVCKVTYDGFHARVCVGDRAYRAWGLETTNAEVIGWTEGATAGRAATIEIFGAEAHTANRKGTLTVKLRRPGVIDSAVILFWLLYFGAGHLVAS